jgi:hypothetical protein
VKQEFLSCYCRSARSSDRVEAVLRTLTFGLAGRGGAKLFIACCSNGTDRGAGDAPPTWHSARSPVHYSRCDEHPDIPVRVLEAPC